jgi:hypothetical protein
VDSQGLGLIRQTVFSLALLSFIRPCKTLYRQDGRESRNSAFIFIIIIIIILVAAQNYKNNNNNNNNNKQSIKLPSLFFSELLWRKVYKMMKVNLQLVLGFKVLDYFFGSIFQGQAELKQCSTFKGTLTFKGKARG